MPARCDPHDEDFKWVEISPGKRKFCCESCHNKARADRTKTRLEFPHVKFAQNFHRDRNYSSYENSMPGGRAKRPQF